MSLPVLHFCVFSILCGTAYSDPICRVTYKAADCKGDVMSYTPMTAGGCQMYVEKAGPTAGLYYDIAGKGFCKDKECTDCQVPNAKKTPGPVVYDTQCRSQDFVGLAAGVKAPSWNFKKGECPKPKTGIWKRILDDNTTCIKKGRLYGDCTPKCDSAQYCIDFCVKNFPGASHVDYWPTSHLSCANMSKPRCWCNCYNHPGNCTSASGTIRDVSKKTFGAEGGGVETFQLVSASSGGGSATEGVAESAGSDKQLSNEGVVAAVVVVSLLLLGAGVGVAVWFILIKTRMKQEKGDSRATVTVVLPSDKYIDSE